jgi:uncharacterized membrane protein YqgA involved in biofilm formation
MTTETRGRGRVQELLLDGVMAIGLALLLPIGIILVALPFVLAVRALIEIAARL